MQSVRRQLDQLFLAHAALAVVSGALCFLTPHSLLSPILGDANNSHLAHEFIRLYGTLRLSLLSPSGTVPLASRSSRCGTQAR